jgi:outer membrane protein OmpA-like peptidoglycan-associated protein
MATSLFDTIKGCLAPEVVSQAGAFVGENPDTTRRGLEAGAATLLAGLMQQAESADGPNRILALVNRYGSRDVPANLSQVLSSGSGAQGLMAGGRDILNALFGGRLDSVAGVIARFTGARNASAGSMLALVAPLVMSVLGRVRTTQGLDASGLVRLLADQRQTIARVAPPGLGTALGLRAPLDADTTAHAAYRSTADSSTSPVRWIASLVVIGVLLSGLWYAMRGRQAMDTGAVPPADVGAPTAGVRPRVVEELAEVTLPNGGSVRLDPRSSLYDLAHYLGSNDPGVPKRFVIERLNFDTDSTRLTADSTQTVDDLSLILRAYPSAQMRLEGHTDTVGDTDTNRKLSLARAEAVKDALSARGVDANRLTAVGQGQDRPLASNDSEEGRAQNRRLEVIVTEK